MANLITKNPKFQEVMMKEITRKEFVKHLGLMVAGVVGIGNMLNMLIEHKPHQPNQIKASRGFGSSKFGI